MDTMSILECEDKAKAEGSDSATFDLIAPTGVYKCKWLDAYIGAFQIEGHNGFVMARDFKNMPVRCANFSSDGSTRA